MSIDYHLIDSFTATPFGGNPAAVVLTKGPHSADWMQLVAAEMNLSETAFVDISKPDKLPLRWFTPTSEVDLCGHATLASAHVIGKSCTFTTNSGDLVCHVHKDGWIEMDFPNDECTEEPASDLLKTIFDGAEIAAYAKGTWDALVELKSEDDVLAFKPDFDAIASLRTRGFIVTARSASTDLDFTSRCFYPNVGINEDPVTGSAHCTLAHWWSNRLDKHKLNAFQASQRGGHLRLEVKGQRTHIFGQAVTVATGQLKV